MSSKKRVFKRGYENCGGNEGCKSFPSFRISSCPFVPPKVEPVPVFIPVYGSLTTPPSMGSIAVAGTNVDFEVVGPFSGTTPNIIDDSITVNSSGVYTISFSTELFTNGSPGTPHSIIFCLSINGTPDFSKEIAFQTNFPIGSTATETDTLSRTDQFTLNQGDVIRVLISSTSGSMVYFNAALVVTKVA